MPTVRILMIGDVVGQPGRVLLADRLPGLIQQYGIDFTVVNGENAAGGFGITPRIASAFFHQGVDVITSGNHIWRNKDVYRILDKEQRLLRPVNYPDGAPGFGSGLYEKQGVKYGVINALGRVFMDPVDCPFLATAAEGKRLREAGAAVLIVDFHAEATSEKVALGHYLDGKFSLVAGTHTHVQTADARILAGGTGYISDLGMTGATDSVIGICKERAVQKFISGMPVKFEPGEGRVELNGVVCEVDPETGRAVRIFPVSLKPEQDPVTGMVLLNEENYGEINDA